jgi:hypothetical protein
MPLCAAAHHSMSRAYAHPCAANPFPVCQWRPWGRDGTVALVWLEKRGMQDRMQWLRQDSGRDTAARPAYHVSLPVPAVLAECALSLLGEERA